jgi:hypothetical protein
MEGIGPRQGRQGRFLVCAMCQFVSGSPSVDAYCVVVSGVETRDIWVWENAYFLLRLNTFTCHVLIA